MKRFFKKGLEIRDWRFTTRLLSNLQSPISNLLLLIIPILYIATLAQSPVLGDPTEYTFVANTLGIAHPPGYVFITVMGKLFQTMIPFGSIPWRMHLLSATSASLAALFVYGTVRESQYRGETSGEKGRSAWQGATPAVPPLRISNLQSLISIFTALTVATAVNHWQHAIHANPHIITATFLAANLFFLTKWATSDKMMATKGRRWQGDTVKESHPVTQSPPHPITLSQKWLYIFCFSAGLGVTHHPLTAFAFPAYAIFILLKRPSLLRDWRTLLKMVGLALLGLSLWLYYPIVSSTEPTFGPSTMNTLDGFLTHVLGRGITEGLTFYTLAEQPNRLRIFWSLLRLQYSLPVIFLAIFAVSWPIFSKVARWKGGKVADNHLITLYALAFFFQFIFVINLRQQDIMAYLLGPLLVVGLLAGIGLQTLFSLVSNWLNSSSIAYNIREQRRNQKFFTRIGGNTDINFKNSVPPNPYKHQNGLRKPTVSWTLYAILALFFILGPVMQIARNGSRVSLRDYTEGEVYVADVFGWFNGRSKQAVLLNDWEHMTPLWYTQAVEQRWPNPDDVRPVFVSTARTWTDNVYDFLSGGPVYLSSYKREVVDAGFRLRPAGPFYQVVEPKDHSIPPELSLINFSSGKIEVVGYGWGETATAGFVAATAGDYVPLTLAMRTPTGTTDFYVPIIQVGNLSFPFTTDSHLTTPNWLPGEIIVERFDLALPHDLPAGSYPVTLRLKNLSKDALSDTELDLGHLDVTAQANPVQTSHLLANFRQRVGLVGASAKGNGRRADAPWGEPIYAKRGEIINLTLEWQSLAKAEESYTIFVHLINLADQPVIDDLDYTPLGGAFPTHLWIPKWLPGQRVIDPYRMQIPPDLAPDTYQIEVGIYEMTSGRRLHIADSHGNLIGDRIVLGTVVVEQ